ncbi:WD repeat-containing protein 44-like [Senna tora]|uniref:WD repeat-containing protein 44-like n=1 Tax=Senna tora TaxID=362788 RepID=A0A835CME4_9FABA|nr:WD repeat-containing protein 44-like [Senna tora]
MQRRKSFGLNWDGLNDNEDDDDFFETRERMSTAVRLDLEASSSDEEDGFEDSRMSFSSTISPNRSEKPKSSPPPSAATTTTTTVGSEYDMWMASPGSIRERRKRLLLGMGLDENKQLLRVTSAALDRAISKKFENGNVIFSNPSPSPSTTTSSPHHSPSPSTSTSSSSSTKNAESSDQRIKTKKPSIIPFVLGRSRSEGDIDEFSMPKYRREEFIGKISKQRLTKTASDISLLRSSGGGGGAARKCPETTARESQEAGPPAGHGRKLSAVKSNTGLRAFFLIKNLDTGKEFIVNEYNEDGMWNRLRDLQTGKGLTMEEFEKTVGHSPVVKELMSRDKVVRSSSDGLGYDRKLTAQHSYFSRSLRKSKRTGAALLKNIKGVASGFIGEREREETHKASPQLTTSPSEQKGSKNEDWVKVRQSGKSCKELSALHLCQEFQAHEGCVWVMRFSWDGHYLASAGEDKVVHVWEVQEFEGEDGSLTPIHPSMRNGREEGNEKKKKGKHGSKRGGSTEIPDYVRLPETMFSLSEKPYCSFDGHSDDILDLAWSKSQLLLSSSMDKTVRLWDLETKACMKVFTHNDYVTCIHFNPMDDDYFISGSLDAKVRIWNIPQRYVVDWIDVHEMVTAISYTPDGQAAFVGTHKGSCRAYSIEDCKLCHVCSVELRRKKKSHLRKVTGFQFAPGNPSEVLVTSADSRTRIVEGSKVVHKFIGFRNTNSQIAASFSPDGRYVISASEDSQVFVWKNEGHGKCRNLVVTRSHEHFQCKDVSVAIPWPRTMKCDLQMGTPDQSKRHSKRFSHNAIPVSPSIVENHKKRTLPPLPKKRNGHTFEMPSPSCDPSAVTSRGLGSDSFGHSSSKKMWAPFFKKNDHHHAGEEDPAAISRTNSGIGDSFSSSRSDSIRYGDSPSMNSSFFENANPNAAWGLVIVTAGFGGEIRCYQNFGLPRKL